MKPYNRVRNVRFILTSVLLLLFWPTPALAASRDCILYHRVEVGDTLRDLSAMYDVAPWDIVAANRNQAQRPNYPIYVGARLCIPERGDNPKALQPWVLDQPAAQLVARQSGRTVTISAYNFARNSNWSVVVDGYKVGKMKMFSKGLTAKGFRGVARRVCLKNQVTDLLVCSPVY